MEGRHIRGVKMNINWEKGITATSRMNMDVEEYV
jgi:hypothetical protein